MIETNDFLELPDNWRELDFEPRDAADFVLPDPYAILPPPPWLVLIDVAFWLVCGLGMLARRAAYGAVGCKPPPGEAIASVCGYALISASVLLTVLLLLVGLWYAAMALHLCA